MTTKATYTTEGDAYTPGPWDTEELKVISLHNGIVVAYCENADGSLPSQQEDANAHLIAAAPSLVEALKNVAGMLPISSKLHPDDLIKLQTQVVAALKAAGVEI